MCLKKNTKWHLQSSSTSWKSHMTFIVSLELKTQRHKIKCKILWGYGYNVNKKGGDNSYIAVSLILVISNQLFYHRTSLEEGCLIMSHHHVGRVKIIGDFEEFPEKIKYNRVMKELVYSIKLFYLHCYGVNLSYKSCSLEPLTCCIS